MFSGANGPERGASIIIELNNGGTEVQNVLTNDMRYYNMWQRSTFNGVQTKQQQQWGWMSNQKTVQELWVYAKDTIEQPALPVRPRSRYLLHEMSLARWDPLRRRGEVPEGNGQHDDRISAALFALWQLRGFVPAGSYYEAGRAIAQASKRTGLDFQALDIASQDEYDNATDAWMNRILHGW